MLLSDLMTYKVCAMLFLNTALAYLFKLILLCLRRKVELRRWVSVTGLKNCRSKYCCLFIELGDREDKVCFD